MISAGNINFLLVAAINPMEDIFNSASKAFRTRLHQIFMIIIRLINSILNFFISLITLFLYTIYIRIPFLIFKYLWLHVGIAVATGIWNSSFVKALCINRSSIEYEGNSLIL